MFMILDGLKLLNISTSDAVLWMSLEGATSFPDWGSYEYDKIRVSVCLLCL